MPATWVREAVLMLFVWFIAHHYQYWGTIGLLRKTQPEPQPESLSPQVEKKPEKAEKEFQGLTVKPVCTACEHACRGSTSDVARATSYN